MQKILTEDQAKEFVNAVLASNIAGEIIAYHRCLTLALRLKTIGPNDSVLEKINALESVYSKLPSNKIRVLENASDLEIILVPIGLYKSSKADNKNNAKLIEKYILHTVKIIEDDYHFTFNKGKDFGAVNPNLVDFFKKEKLVSLMGNFYYSNSYAIKGINTLYSTTNAVPTIYAFYNYAITYGSLKDAAPYLSMEDDDFNGELLKEKHYESIKSFDLFDCSSPDIRFLFFKMFGLFNSALENSKDLEILEVIKETIKNIIQEDAIKGFAEAAASYVHPYFFEDLTLNKKQGEIKFFDKSFANPKHPVYIANPYILSKIYADSSVGKFISKVRNLVHIRYVFEEKTIKYLLKNNISYKDMIKNTSLKDIQSIVTSDIENDSIYPYTQTHKDLFGEYYEDIIKDLVNDSVVNLVKYIASIDTNKEKDRLIKEASRVLKDIEIDIPFYKDIEIDIPFKLDLVIVILKNFKCNPKTLKNAFKLIDFRIKN